MRLAGGWAGGGEVLGHKPVWQQLQGGVSLLWSVLFLPDISQHARQPGVGGPGVNVGGGSQLGGVEFAPPRPESSQPGERSPQTVFPSQGHTAGIWGLLRGATG